MAPLGVITAIVSAIRVYGNSSLKAFIGRAQEAHGQAEAELCSSTSEDVCELWSNGGICRVFGRPKILEFIFIKEKADFYPRPGAEDLTELASCGIFLPRELFGGRSSSTTRDQQMYGWREVNGKKASKEADEEDQPLEKARNFAPYPNLSLNIGIRKVSPKALWVVAVFGIWAQLSFFGFATWITFYKPDLYKDDGPPHIWSFGLATSGTALLVIGMTLCAFLIERNSIERKFCQDQSQVRLHQYLLLKFSNWFLGSEANQDFLAAARWSARWRSIFQRICLFATQTRIYHLMESRSRQ